ncbi:MAG: hypothetical protein K9H16_12275, partial [Bacteroidales bacterium]|nr:hypothetical protein [Bacteroidales bacterium]
MKKLIFATTFAVLLGGHLFAATLIQDKYRWRNDDGSETTATWKAGENVAVKNSGTENIRLRFQFYIPESANMSSWLIAFYYSSSTDGPWTPITTDGSTNHFMLSSSENIADQEASTRQLSENTEHTFEAGKIIESTSFSPFALGTSKSTEYEVCFRATVNAENAIYYFKPNVAYSENEPSTNIFTFYEYAIMAYKIIFVDSGATGSDNGTSWTNAYTSLQSALDAAVSGDQIWVAEGTYKPTQKYDGSTTEPREFTFYLKDGVEIYGGFAGTETSLSQRDYLTNETILSGDLSGNDEFQIAVFNVYQNNSGADNCYSVLFNLGNSLTTTAVLDGFTISGGNANTGFPGNAGAGIVTDGTPSLRNLIFTHNYSSGGGALFLVNAVGGNL